VDLVLGHSGPKQIFGGAGVPHTPVAERLVGFAAVGLTLAAVAFGLLRLRRRFTPLAATIAVAGLLYPATLPLRLTQGGTEISNRASEFVFIGVSFLAALAVTETKPRAWPRKLGPALRRVTPAVGLAAAGVLFAGGIIIGWARYSRLPGGYLVVADERTVEREGLFAARWARKELGPGKRILADRANALTMGSIGLENPQGGEIAGRSVPGTITAGAVDANVRYVLVNDQLAFLVVDRRIASGLPAVGFYFERDEPRAYRHRRPPSLAALLKFDHVCPVGRVLDSGQIVVYDTRRMRQHPCARRPRVPDGAGP
jgi:hypothetical protein